jgi:hypothetical protein
VPSPADWLEREPPDRGPATLDQTVAGGLSPGGSGQKVILPGINYFPAGGYPIDSEFDQDIAPGATAILVSLQVPEKLQLRLTGIGFGADDEVALRFLTWNLLLNGDPFRAYTAQAATIGSIPQVSPINFHVRDNCLVTIALTSDATAVITYRFIVRVTGYFFSDER